MSATGRAAWERVAEPSRGQVHFMGPDGFTVCGICFAVASDPEIDGSPTNSPVNCEECLEGAGWFFSRGLPRELALASGPREEVLAGLRQVYKKLFYGDTENSFSLCLENVDNAVTYLESLPARDEALANRMDAAASHWDEEAERVGGAGYVPIKNRAEGLRDATRMVRGGSGPGAHWLTPADADPKGGEA